MPEQEKMTRTQVAAMLITIEAHTTLARAALLLDNEQEFLSMLFIARKQLGELCSKVINGDKNEEQQVYLAN